MPVKPDRQYRRIDVKNLETRQEGDQMIVEGYASTFGQPYLLFEDQGIRVLEEISPSAFDDCDMSDVIMQYDHQGRVFARTRNGTLSVKPDDHGLFIRAYLGGTQIGRQLFEEIQGGYTDRMSFGFTIASDPEEERITDEDGRTAVLSRITAVGKLYDVSAVSLPANDATEISARSRCEGAIARIMEERHAQAERERKLKLIQIKLKNGGKNL